MPSLHTLRRGVLLGSLLTFGALSGCDSVLPGSGSADDDAGTFEVRVTGAVQTAFDGIAAFHDQAVTGGGPGFAIALANDVAGDGTGLVFTAPGVPTARTYTVVRTGAEAATQASAVLVTSGSAGLFGSTAGTLTVTSVSAERLVGRFQFNAEGASGGRTVKAQGTFEAVRAVGGTGG